MYPNIRWLLISGSPCQDLTFAGYLNGLLGLTGRRSMLFFVVYVVLRHAQKLFGFEYVRYLAENAGGARRQQHERRAPLGTIRTFSALSILPYPVRYQQNTGHGTPVLGLELGDKECSCEVTLTQVPLCLTALLATNSGARFFTLQMNP